MLLHNRFAPPTVNRRDREREEEKYRGRVGLVASLDLSWVSDGDTDDFVGVGHH